MNSFATFIGQYNSSPLTLTSGDYGTAALDSSSRLILDHSTSSIKIGDGTDILDVVAWNAASVGTEKGFVPFGVYKANATNLADTDGDFVPFQFTNEGRLRVDAEIAIATGSDKAEDSAHSSGDIGAYVLAVRADTRPTNSNVSADGDYSSIFVNTSGEVYVKDTDVASALSTIDSVLDSILVDTGNIDDSLNNIETDVSTIAGDTTSIDSTLTALSKAEDSVHSSGDQGIMALAVANEAGTDLVSADGDYTPIATNKAGKVYTISEVAEAGTEIDVGVDEAGDGEVDVAYHASNFTDVLTIAVAAGETLFIKGWDISSDVLIEARLCVYDDTSLTKVIRKVPAIENNPGLNFNWLRGIEVAGGATISVKFQARCMRNNKTAHVGGGINAYK